MAGVGYDLCADASSWFSVVVPVDVVDFMSGTEWPFWQIFFYSSVKSTFLNCPQNNSIIYAYPCKNY